MKNRSTLDLLLTTIIGLWFVHFALSIHAHRNIGFLFQLFLVAVGFLFVLLSVDELLAKLHKELIVARVRESAE